VASFIGNYNLLASSDFEKLTRRKTQASQVAIRPEAIEYFKEPQPQTEEHLYFTGKVVDETISGNILSYVIETEQGVQLRADHLYRTFNLLDKGEQVFLKVEKRNVLEF
jgi:putative spermidine/putrescine transport system ATP-binding protein